MKIHSVLCILLCFLLIIVSTWTLISFYKLQKNKDMNVFSDTYINTGIITGWCMIILSVIILILFLIELLK